jgi:hypothetical protein
MDKPLISAPGYERSLAALGESVVVQRALHLLLTKIAKEPERWPVVSPEGSRVMKSHAHPELAGLRLCYRVESDAIYLESVARVN